MRSGRIAAAIVALLLVLGSATDAPANSRRSEAERELQITKSVIEKVRRLVDESENRRARDTLRRAMDLQNRAEREFRGNGFAVTVKLTLVAREYAKRAGKLAGEPSENREFVFRQLERTRDMLRKTREHAGEIGETQAEEILRAAYERQDQAETAFREHRFRVSLRMTQLARELAQKALEMVGEEPGASPQRVLSAMKETDEILGRVSRDLGGTRSPLLEEAYELQDRAEAHLNGGRFGPALKLTLTARDLAKKAVVGPEGSDAVAGEMRSTKALTERAEAAARESGSETAGTLVGEARKHIERAEAHFRDADYVAARAQLKLARRKAERALEVAGGP
jgi:hypothetical protein